MSRELGNEAPFVQQAFQLSLIAPSPVESFYSYKLSGQGFETLVKTILFYTNLREIFSQPSLNFSAFIPKSQFDRLYIALYHGIIFLYFYYLYGQFPECLTMCPFENPFKNIIT